MTNKIGKVVPTKDAAVNIQETKASKSVLVEIVASQPEKIKKQILAEVSKTIATLSKTSNLTIVLTQRSPS